MEQAYPDFLEIIKYLIIGIFSSITQIFVSIVCIYFYRKIGSSVERILLLIGSLLLTLFTILSSSSIAFYMFLGANQYATILYIFQIGSFLGSLLFAIGFLITIRKIVKTKMITQNL
ncbi:hypothetical protein [uncultured Aquimarina sp.]|uniref:hypothetical protein n=1 Tax=uncultured Aquimarina sp. TaxID=575652 RepID=UPI00260B2AE6|nr:hypothetical protein [uncultured Aquimarina sp.]